MEHINPVIGIFLVLLAFTAAGWVVTLFWRMVAYHNGKTVKFRMTRVVPLGFTWLLHRRPRMARFLVVEIPGFFFTWSPPSYSIQFLIFDIHVYPNIRR